MADCRKCLAPIAFDGRDSVTCAFCGASNARPPDIVPVAVPVTVVHNVVHVSPADSVREVRCPHCKRPLVGVEAEGVALNGCIGCGGVWVANACAQRILEKPLPIFDELARRAAANARGRFVRAERPACPICDATLDAVTVAAIPLDVCAAHGTWFDGNELALLVSALLRAKPGTPIASRVGTVSCVGCRVELAESAANIGVRGPTCDACFRQYTRQLIAEADAKHGQRQTIGGVLALGLAAALLGGARGSRS